MTIILWLTICILLFDSFFIATSLLQQALSATPPALLQIAPLFVLVGALAALIAFLFNLRRSRSAETLEAATELLAKAYTTLAPTANEPINDRHAWLSAARLLATAEKLRKHLVEPNHKIIYEEREEYWRGRLYDLIFPSPPAGLASNFYAEQPEHMIAYVGQVRSPIAEKSLAFLYRFIKWPDGREDPISQVPIFSDEEIEQMRTFGPRGLGDLLAEVRNLAQHESGQ